MSCGGVVGGKYIMRSTIKRIGQNNAQGALHLI
jgi:hypothetical protein